MDRVSIVSGSDAPTSGEQIDDATPRETSPPIEPPVVEMSGASDTATAGSVSGPEAPVQATSVSAEVMQSESVVVSQPVQIPVQGAISKMATSQGPGASHVEAAVQLTSMANVINAVPMVSNIEVEPMEVSSMSEMEMPGVPPVRLPVRMPEGVLESESHTEVPVQVSIPEMVQSAPVVAHVHAEPGVNPDSRTDLPVQITISEVTTAPLVSDIKLPLKVSVMPGLDSESHEMELKQPVQGATISEIVTSAPVVSHAETPVQVISSHAETSGQVGAIAENVSVQETSEANTIGDTDNIGISVAGSLPVVYEATVQHKEQQVLSPDGTSLVVPEIVPDRGTLSGEAVQNAVEVIVPDTANMTAPVTAASVAAGSQQIEIVTDQGQSIAMETSDQLQSGVVYVLTQDQARVPTKASRKAFIPEGQTGPQQIIIVPKSQTAEIVNGASLEIRTQVIEVVGSKQQPAVVDVGTNEEIGQLQQEFQSDASAQKAHQCHTCGQSFYMYLELLRHVMSAHSNALPAPTGPRATSDAAADPNDQYECNECKLRFKKVEHLNEHIAMHFVVKAGGGPQVPEEESAEVEEVEEEEVEEPTRQVGEKKHACDLCDKKFTRAFGLKNHKRVHTGSKPYECEVCSKTFRELSKLKNHMAMHTDAKPFICPVCAKAFAAGAYLRTHMMIHTGKKPYKCSQCDMAFISSGNLKRHMRVHTGEKPFSCDFCGATFAQMGNLESHKRTHTGVRPYECEICGKGFMQSSGLVEHIRTHSGVKPYSCDICGRAFAGSSGLRVHKRTHTGEKPHECDICLKRFAASGNLKTHRKIHADIRPFKCTYCNKCFVASGNLTQHLRIHTGEKPHKCTICDKAFTGTGGLKIHMMGHYDEKPYMCEYCDKGFKTKQKLTAHTRSHTGERPYPCNLCDKTFAMAEKLKAHVRVKHTVTTTPSRTVQRAQVQYGTVADYNDDDDLGPPVLSPQPLTPIHAPPVEVEITAVTSATPRTSRRLRQKQQGEPVATTSGDDPYQFDRVESSPPSGSNEANAMDVC